MNSLNERVISIDASRALIMLLMIFVNGLHELSNIPKWLLHTAAETDGMGLSDVVLPGFMFIIGLSIPHAIISRTHATTGSTRVISHILKRAASLVVMGLFMVNYLHINHQELLISSHYWLLMLYTSFFLIWNDYPQTKIFKFIPSYGLRLCGLIIMVVLATIYIDNNNQWMKPHWWGILGLLGISYGLCAIIYFLSKGKFCWLIAALTIFLLLNINEFNDNYNFKIIISASNYFMVMAGVLVANIFLLPAQALRTKKLFLILTTASFIFFIFGFTTRPFWEISKIRATPSWSTISIGICIVFYLFVYFITEVKNHTGWLKCISAAGSATLTCYILSFFIISLLDLTPFNLRELFPAGIPGMIKVFIYALFVIQVTQWLNNRGISLKI